ncbi:hypothetical protein NECID01_2097 [Nematocida sp. AWRm77]|nr:hypothetical protein NECID01_2097 [Nematocida sp. AWRm77]
MNLWTITGAALLGALHPIRNRKQGRKNTAVLLGSSVGVLTCFFGVARLEYLNMLRGRPLRTLSPGGTLLLGGFYSAGALSSMALSLSSSLLVNGVSSLKLKHLPAQ